jgi:lysine-N-methylase
MIDKKTYKKYENVKDITLKKELDINIKRNRGETTQYGYARVNLKENGYCPFLSEDKLCNIQKKLGAEHLSNVCMDYPRMNTRVQDGYERSLALSCPEAVRRVLFNPDIMEFDQMEENIERDFTLVNILNANPDNKVTEYFWELRIFTISLLQNRSYRLDERLIILGLFYKQLQNYLENDNSDKILSLINNYDLFIKTGQLRESIRNTGENYTIQMELLKELCDIRANSRINCKEYLNVIDEFLQGLGYIDLSNIDESSIKYKEAYDNYYKIYMENKEYILENYLVNYTFMNLFPYDEDKSVYQQYILLVLRFALIKMLLIGLSAYHKEISENLIVRLFYSFTRVVDHDLNFMNNALKILEEQNFTTIGYLTILIKN